MAALPVSPEVAPTILSRSLAFRQDIFEEIAEELQGHILEGQGDAVKQFQDVDPILSARPGSLRDG